MLCERDRLCVQSRVALLPPNPQLLMKSPGLFFRAGIVFCLALLAGSALGQPSLVGTNAPGSASNYVFTIPAGITNFSMVVSGGVSAYSHLLVRRGQVATDTDYDFSSRWNGTNNSIYLEAPQVFATDFHIRVRTPASSATHSYTVVLQTNTSGFKSATKPTMRPIHTTALTIHWITNGGRH